MMSGYKYQGHCPYISYILLFPEEGGGTHLAATTAPPYYRSSNNDFSDNLREEVIHLSSSLRKTIDHFKFSLLMNSCSVFSMVGKK